MLGQISIFLFIPIYRFTFSQVYRFPIFVLSPWGERVARALQVFFRLHGGEKKAMEGLFVFPTLWRETTNLQKKSNFYQLYTSFWTKDAFETERTNAKSKRSVLLILGR